MQIRQYRLRKGISQKELAAIVGVTPQYLCCLEKGKKTNPSLNLLQSIANALDVKVSVLLSTKAAS